MFYSLVKKNFWTKLFFSDGGSSAALRDASSDSLLSGRNDSDDELYDGAVRGHGTRGKRGGRGGRGRGGEHGPGNLGG